MAGLKARIPEFLKMISVHSTYLDHNRKLLEILKGNLLPYVEQSLREQLSGDPLKSATQRIAPINVLRRIIDKQSKIYNNGVTRAMDGTESDKALLSWYQKTLKPDRKFTTANRHFNLTKNALIRPYLDDEGMPAIRVIPADRFLPFADEKYGDDKPDGFVLVMGKIQSAGGDVTLYQAINDEEFMFFTSNGDVVTSTYSPNNTDGVNPFRVLPFVYLNRDDDCLIPTIDSDTLAMTLLIPVLFTDINFAHMFQAFSILYGINLSDQGIKFGPSAFWNFKTEPGSDQKVEIGTIDPKADISGGLELIANQFALWLNTRGLKAGAIGEINGQNFASGIAKIIDEMDTSEDRKEQVPFFVDAEAEFWNLLLQKMHPVWVKQPEYRGEMKELASITAIVKTDFSEQLPLVRRGQVLDECLKERDGRLTTQLRALARLNPDLTEDKLKELDAEIKAEKPIVDPTIGANMPPKPKVPNPGL